MAKDDYDVIVYRLLVYLYACLKRKIIYDEITFREAVRKNVENDGYFADILFLMQEEGLIKNIKFVDAWGGDRIISSSLKDIEITVKGIHYLKDNDKMASIAGTLKAAGDIIAKLAAIVL